MDEKRREKAREAAASPSSSTARFANATSISSDQFFGRGDYAETSADDKARLSRFSGAGAISSDAFFDREEPPEEDDTLDLSDLRDTIVSKGKAFLDILRG